MDYRSERPYEPEWSRQGAYVESLEEYVSKTFLWMVLGLMITFAVAMVCWITGLTYFVARFHWVVLIATLIVAFTMAARIQSMSSGEAKAIFLGYSALFGLTMSVYMLMFGLGSMLFAFLAAALYFGVMAAYGHFTHRDLSNYRHILFTGLLMLILAGIVLLIVPGFSGFDRMMCLGGIAVFLGYTAYDTQKIRQLYDYYAGYPELLEKASIFAALQLYLDFINLFLYLLRYFNSRKD